MPTLPSNTLCAAFNCKELRSRMNTFCLAHGGKDSSPPTLDHAHYRSPAWRSIRRRQLSLQPLCQACLTRGHVCAAEHVDHLFPWRAIRDGAFLNNIFQSLCQPCHSHKTGQEQKGIIEHYKDGNTIAYVLGDYAFVMATFHSNLGQSVFVVLSAMPAHSNPMATDNI